MAKKSPASVPEKDTAIELQIDGKTRLFDIDDPVLPDWIEKRALGSGGYPYKDKMKSKEYDADYEALQIEMVKLQIWMQSSGDRIMVLFEGRDAAGKGGTIEAIRENMNPRTARNVALTKPTETERGQMYYQRYVTHFPTAGEFVTFDRSWYNRAGVEPVMGFCTPEQYEHFLEETPAFERLIRNDGIRLFKIWLDIGQEMQLKQFHQRRHSPLKSWKFSPIDIAGIKLWDKYTQARDTMITRTHSDHAPWTIVRSNDRKRARLAVMRRILRTISYKGRDMDVIGEEDAKIIGSGARFLLT
ncbi:MAG: polyphosphate kinase 2 [Mesorhizobium sp.]